MENRDVFQCPVRTRTCIKDCFGNVTQEGRTEGRREGGRDRAGEESCLRPEHLPPTLAVPLCSDLPMAAPLGLGPLLQTFPPQRNLPDCSCSCSSSCRVFHVSLSPSDHHYYPSLCCLFVCFVITYLQLIQCELPEGQSFVLGLSISLTTHLDQMLSKHLISERNMDGWMGG